MVVIRSVVLICETGTAQGLNALPLMWEVQARHTRMPQPYLGPVTPRTSRSTHRRRTSSSASTRTRLPFRMKECSGTVSAFGKGLLDEAQPVDRALRDGGDLRLHL